MKARTVGGEFTIDSAPDDSGNGWYVGISIRSESTWLYPDEARRLARLLRLAATKPRKKRKKK